MQNKHEPQRKYYRHMRAMYFQGCNAPGPCFLHNQHESMQYDITMHHASWNALGSTSLSRTKFLSIPFTYTLIQDSCSLIRTSWLTSPTHWPLWIHLNSGWHPKATLFHRQSASPRWTSLRHPGALRTPTNAHASYRAWSWYLSLQVTCEPTLSAGQQSKLFPHSLVFLPAWHSQPGSVISGLSQKWSPGHWTRACVSRHTIPQICQVASEVGVTAPM